MRHGNLGGSGVQPHDENLVMGTIHRMRAEQLNSGFSNDNKVIAQTLNDAELLGVRLEFGNYPTLRNLSLTGDFVPMSAGR